AAAATAPQETQRSQLFSSFGGLTEPAAGAPAAFARAAERLAGLGGGVSWRGAELGERVDERDDRGPGRGDVYPQPEVAGRFRCLGSDYPDHGDRVRFAGDADQVPDGRGRGEQHGVESAALDRLADGGGRRGGAYRAVGGHVLRFP